MMNVLKRVVVKSGGGVYYCVNHHHQRNLGSLPSSSYYHRILSSSPSTTITATARFDYRPSFSSRSFDNASLRHSHGFLLSRCVQSTPASVVNGNWKTTTMKSRGLIHTTFRFNHQIANDKTDSFDVDIAKIEDQIQTLCNENKIDEAFQVFSSHVTQNGATRFITYCKNKGDENSQRLSMDVYRTLISSNITPNKQLFSDLIYLCNTVNKFNKTLTLFFDMEKYQIKLDKHSFPQLTFATYKTNNKTTAKKLVEILKNGVDFQPLTKHCNALLSVLENIDDSMWLMHFMVKNNIEIDKGCFIKLFKACASHGPLAYKHGKQVYDQLLKTPHSTNQEILNYVLQMFAKCDQIKQAINAFESTEQQPNPVLWNCIIGLCAKNGEPNKSIELYDKMISNNITPDPITFINILIAISNLGPNALEKGKQIHQQITQHKLYTNTRLKIALDDMYNKCGK